MLIAAKSGMMGIHKLINAGYWVDENACGGGVPSTMEQAAQSARTIRPLRVVLFRECL
jgi:hypothetical protein